MIKPYEFYQLNNGVRVILVPMSGVESVAMGVYVGAGSRDETADTNGIAHFLEHLTFRGTKKYPTRAHTSILEGLGGIQNGWTYSESTSYWAKFPADKWKMGLEVQKELALHPRLRPQDLEQERGVILEEIHRRDDSPDEKVWEVFYHMRFPNQPLGWSTLGQPKVVKRLSTADFAAFHAQNYTSSRLLVAAAGQILDRDSLKSQIETWFNKLPKTSLPIRPRPRSVSGKVEIVTKPDAQQTQIVLGVNTFPMSDPRRHALRLIDRILGYGLSSRLFKNVRDKLGLAYVIHSDFDLEADHGYWAAYAGVKTAKLKQAVTAILAEMARLKSELVSEEELLQAKAKTRGPLLFAMENPYNQMEFYAHQALWQPQQISTYQDLIHQTMQVTPEQIRALARQLFTADQLNLAVVGPIQPSLQHRLAKLLTV